MIQRFHSIIDALLQQKDETLEFRQHLRQQIHFRGTVSSLACLAIALTTFFMDLQQEQYDDYTESEMASDCSSRFDFDMADHRTVYFVSLLVVICALGTFVIISMLGCFNKLSKVIWWESVFCITFSIVFVMMPFATSDSRSTHFSVFRLSEHDRDKADWLCFWKSSNYGGSKSEENVKLVLYMDVLITGAALYIPLRPIAMFFIFLLCFLSFLIHAILFNVTENSQYWLSPAMSLMVLGMAAFRGACDQNALRWETWKAHRELHELSAMGRAMTQIATSFCDCVITLTHDLRLPNTEDTKLQAFFGTSWRSRPLTDFLSVLDACRFNELVAQTRASNVPGCISMTLHVCDDHFVMEVTIMLVLTTGDSFLMGISQSSEQVRLIAEDMILQPQPTCLGHDGDALSYSVSNQGHAPALHQHTSSSITEPSVIATSQIFMDIDNIDQIHDLGVSEHWIVNHDTVEIEFDNLLGRGGFGCVYAGKLCGSPVAIKCAQANSDETYEKMRRHLISAANEVRVLRHVRHPNIALFHGLWLFSNSMRLVFEKVSGQSLIEFALGGEIRMAFQQPILLDISCALWYLHARVPPIVHGDLKPANIMIEMRIPVFKYELRPCAKLIDFGLSRVLSRHAEPLGGTRSYRAPEVRAQGRPVIASDVYSFGCTVFFISSGSDPQNPLLHDDYASLRKWKKIYDKCVSINVAERPSMSEIHSEIANTSPSEESLTRSL